MIRGVIQSATALIYRWWTPPVDAMKKHQEELEYVTLRETKLENRILLSANPLIAVDDGGDLGIDAGAAAGDGIDENFHVRLTGSLDGSQVEIVVHDQAYHLGEVRDVKSIRLDEAYENDLAESQTGEFDRSAIDFVEGSDVGPGNQVAIGEDFSSANEQDLSSVSKTLPDKFKGDVQFSAPDVTASQSEITQIETEDGASLSSAAESTAQGVAIERAGFQFATEQDAAGDSLGKISSSQPSKANPVELEDAASFELGGNESIHSEDGFGRATYRGQDVGNGLVSIHELQPSSANELGLEQQERVQLETETHSNAQLDLDEIVFVDTRVQDYSQLISGIATDVEVVLLSPAQNGLDQIVTALEGKDNLNAIHLISHGSAGTVFLGSQELTVNNVDQYSEQWSLIGDALAETGDLLFYGCSVAEGTEGAGFIASVAEATGADVAASVDSTGSDRLGGDWEFESVHGSLEIGVVVDNLTRTGYAFILATPKVLSVEVDDLFITDADIGGTFTVTVTFDQAMDISVASTPTLTFDPDVVPSGGETLINPSAGSWSVGDTVFTRTYEVVDVGVNFSNIEIDVTGAQNAGGQSLSPYNPDPEFSIDTENPTATVDLPATSLSDSNTSTDLTITFTEVPTGFDAGADLTVIGGALGSGSFDATGLVWTSTYTATDGFTGTGSVTLAAASYTDAAGNTGSDNSDFVSIDTENPTATVDLPATSLSDSNTSTDLTITFTEVPTGFDAGADLTVIGGALGSGSFDATGLVWTSTYTATDGFTGTGSVTLAAASYTDAAGNTGSDNSDFVSIDTENPIIESVVRANVDYTNAAFVDFTVTFSENVTGVDTTGADFSLVTSVTGASIVSVSGSDSVYTVTVGTGSTGGSIGLALAAIPTIQDAIGNDLSDTDISGANESYTIASTEVLLTAGDVLVKDIRDATADDLTLSVVGSNLVISSSSDAIAVGVGVTRINGSSVSIALADITGSDGVTVSTGGLDDTITVEGVGRRLDIDGGSGTDIVQFQTNAITTNGSALLVNANLVSQDVNASINADAVSLIATDGNLELNAALFASGDLFLDASGEVSQTLQGVVVVAGDTTVSANEITLDNASNDFQGTVNASGSDLVFVDSNGISLGDIDATGAFSVTALSGAIDDGTASGNSADVNVAGVATFAASGTISLDDQWNDFGDQISVDAQEFELIAQDDLLLFDVVVDQLAIIAGGNIFSVEAGTVLVTGNASFTGNSVTLGNNVGDVAKFGSLKFNASGVVNISEDDSMTISGASTAGAGLDLWSTDDVTLGASVTVGGDTSILAGTTVGGIAINAKLDGSGTILLDAADEITISAAIDPTMVKLNADDDITVTAAVVASELITVSAGEDGSGSFILGASGSLKTTDLGSDIIVTAGTTSGDITLTGTTTALDLVTMTTASGSINGSGLVTSDMVDLNASTAIGNTVGVMLSSSKIAANTTTGDVEIGNSLGTAVDVLSLTTGTGSISFDQSGGGDLSTGTVGASGAVTLANTAGSLSLAGTVVGGALDATATGAITDDSDGDLAIADLAEFVAGSIELGNESGNSINFGKLTFNSSGSVVIGEDSSLDLVGINTAGSADLDSTADVSDAGATSLNVTDLLDVSGTSIVLGAGTFNTGKLTFNSSGSVNIDEASSMTISSFSSAGAGLDLVSIDDVALNASVTVFGNTSIIAGPTSGGITVNANLNGSGTILLDTANDITLTGTTTALDLVTMTTANGSINGSGLITSNTVDLNASTGIGNTTRVALSSSNITADTTIGNVEIASSFGTVVGVSSLTTDSGSVNFIQSGGGELSTGTVSAPGSVVLSNTGGSINGSGLITSNTVDLNASTGIGNTTGVALSSSNITADTTIGDVEIANSLGTVVGVSSLTTGTGSISFEQSGGGDLSTGTVSAPGSVVLSNTGGSINGSGLITSNTVDLNASTGIGNTTGVALSSSNITADTTIGDVEIANSLGTVVGVSSLTTGTGSISFDQSGGGDLSTGTVSASGVVVLANAAGSISLAGAVDSDSFDVTANGSITDGAGGDLTIAGNASFVGSSIGLGDHVGNDVNFGSLTLNGGTATVTEDDSMLLLGSSALTGELTLVSGGSMLLSGDVSSSSLSAVANGSINGSGLITSNTVDLNASTGIGNTTGVALSSSNITADTTIGDVEIANSLGTVVGVSSLTTGTGSISFEQSGGGDLSTGTVSAPGSVVLSNTGGSMLLSGDVSSSSLSAVANGSITDGTVGDLTIAGHASFVGSLIELGDHVDNDVHFGSLTLTGETATVTEDDSTLLAGTSFLTEGLKLQSKGTITFSPGWQIVRGVDIHNPEVVLQQLDTLVVTDQNANQMMVTSNMRSTDLGGEGKVDQFNFAKIKLEWGVNQGFGVEIDWSTFDGQPDPDVPQIVNSTGIFSHTYNGNSTDEVTVKIQATADFDEKIQLTEKFDSPEEFELTRRSLQVVLKRPSDLPPIVAMEALPQAREMPELKVVPRVAYQPSQPMMAVNAEFIEFESSLTDFVEEDSRWIEVRLVDPINGEITWISEPAQGVLDDASGLKELFMDLPDEHFKFYLILEDGSEQKIFDVMIKNGEPTPVNAESPTELKFFSPLLDSGELPEVRKPGEPVTPKSNLNDGQSRALQPEFEKSVSNNM